MGGYVRKRGLFAKITANLNEGGYISYDITFHTFHTIHIWKDEEGNFLCDECKKEEELR